MAVMPLIYTTYDSRNYNYFIVEPYLLYKTIHFSTETLIATDQRSNRDFPMPYLPT